ncbi:hypothetical protein BGZ73_001127 [Actinomortierella ambigua]|nr:hypothetical protein BGZ73_001127 [Actinomortierella ambigua]
MGIIATSTEFPTLVILNPNSGTKKGRDQFTSVVEPALQKAKVPYKLIETTGQGHALTYFAENIKPILVDLVQSLGQPNAPSSPTSPTLRIIVVGGDGTLHEIVNGILRGIGSEEDGFVTDQFKPKIEFSIIPTGTGNAISTSLGVSSVQDAVDRFLAGKTTPMQVMAVSTPSSSSTAEPYGQPTVKAYTLVVNSYGLHCATVFDSEGLRALGNTRFKVAATKNIMNLKQYAGTLKFYGSVQRYEATTKSLVDDHSAAATDSVDGNNNTPTLTLSGPFTYLLIAKQASLEAGFTPTPLARTSDEWLDVLAVQNASRKEILGMFGATGTGEHIQQDKIEYFKAKAVELEVPAAGRLCIDGEFLDIQAGPSGRVRFEVVSDPKVQLFSVYQ